MLFLLAVNLFIFGATMHLSEEHKRGSYAVLAVGVAVALPVMPTIFNTLRPDYHSFFIPQNSNTTAANAQLVEECHCVIFGGLVILTPLSYDILSIITNIVGNSWRIRFVQEVRSQCFFFFRIDPANEVRLNWDLLHCTEKYCVALPESADFK